ncbi:hypothetical protein [Myxococcus phage Mx1]|nr:hypothetical protein [Myxococcus phage Mx1]
MDLEQPTTTLVVPSGSPNSPAKEIGMSEIYKLEARKQEIANVNKVTAPELMQAFINGYGHASRALVVLEYELQLAQKYMEERKAIVYLEEAPRILKEKGLVRPANPSGSEDQRKAVLALDKEYGQLQNRYYQIEAAAELLRTKAKGFEQAFQAVKKVYDSLSSVNALSGAGAAQLASGNASQIRSVSGDGQPPLAVGKPRYE